MIINYISIKNTIGRFLKEYGLEDTSYVEDLPQWVEDAINIIGISNYYVYKYKLLTVTGSKVCLPCGIENLYGFWVTDSIDVASEKNQMKRLVIRNNPLIGKGVKDEDNVLLYGNINGSYLHTSFETGKVYLVYTGVPLDEEGYPLVPKDAKLNEALQYYFIYKMSLSGFKHPVIDFKTAYQMWEKLYPSAGNSINWMDLQDYQEFTELWTNPLIGDLNKNNYIH